MGYSITLTDPTLTYAINAKVQEFPSPSVAPALVWQKDAAGGWAATDRGNGQDVYESEMTFFGTKSEMDTLAQWIDAHGREGIVLTNMTTPFFAPHLLQVGHTVYASFSSVAAAKQTFTATDGNTGMYEMDATMELSMPSGFEEFPEVEVEASLAKLMLQTGFRADKDYNEQNRYAYDRTPSFADPQNEPGTFTGTFVQNQTDTAAILRYLLDNSHRSTPFDFPTLPGVPYPFGIVHSTLENPASCVCTGITLARENLKRWNLTLTFNEVFT